MKAPRTRISKLVADRTLKNGVSKSLSLQLAAYLLEERRVSELDSILRDVQLYWADAGQVEVIATSAHPLSATVQSDIRQVAMKIFPSAQSVIITKSVDPGIVGGVLLGLPGKQLDMSIETKLNKFKQLTMDGKE